MANSSLRWGRIVLGGFLAEILLILAVIPVYATGGSQTVLTTVAVAGSFLAFVPVAWWLARTTSSPVLHGTLMGAAGAAIYILLTVVGQQIDPNAPPVPWIYYVGHALKLAGGATGGWLAKGARLSNQDSVVRIQ
jgi:hypothetical protein